MRDTDDTAWDMRDTHDTPSDTHTTHHMRDRDDRA